MTMAYLNAKTSFGELIHQRTKLCDCLCLIYQMVSICKKLSAEVSHA